jgi:hypothetical protein
MSPLYPRVGAYARYEPALDKQEHYKKRRRYESARGHYESPVCAVGAAVDEEAERQRVLAKSL